MNLDFDTICRIIGQLYLESYLTKVELQALKSNQEVPNHDQESSGPSTESQD